jgi:O-antigen/teichoic acid export membrane protein
MSTRDTKSHDRAPDDAFKTAAVFSGVRWTTAGQIALESIRVVVSIILAWLLSPADFGLVSMGMVVTGFLVVIQYLGTSGVVIQRKELSNRLLGSLFWLNVGFGLLLTIGLIAAAHPLAMLYHRADVAPIIRVLAVSFVITAIGAVPTALLNRRMQFDLIAKVSFLAAVLQGITGIWLAYAGFGPWALVYSTLVNSVVSTIGYWVLVRWMPPLTFDWTSIKDNMEMMLNLTFGNLVSHLVNDADKFIIGRWLGDVSLGYYTMATRFCLYPPGTIVPIVTRVLYPTYSRMQDDDAGLQKIMIRASGGIAFITMPLMVGLMLLASPFIHTILSSKWDSAIILVAFLAPVGILQSISAGSNGVMLAKDKPQWIFWVAVIKGASTIIALMAGVPWGLTGVAIAYLIVSVPLSAIGFVVAGRLIHMPLWRPFWELRPYVIGSGIMAAVVLGVRFLLVQIGAPMPIQFVTGTVVGAITYIWVMLITRPPAVMDFVRLMPTWLSRLLPRWFTAGAQA